MIAATSPSAPTGNGWRPAAMSGGGPRSGAWAIRTGDRPPAGRPRPGRSFSPDARWLMTTVCTVPAVDRRHLARGAADRRRGALLLPRRPAGGRRRSESGDSPGRGRVGPHGRAAREPRLVRRGLGHLQPRRVAPGGDHQRGPRRPRLGPAGDPPTPGSHGPGLGRAGLSRRRPGRPGRPDPAAAPGRPRPAGPRGRALQRRRPRRWSSGTRRGSRPIPTTPRPIHHRGHALGGLRRLR